MVEGEAKYNLLRDDDAVEFDLDGKWCIYLLNFEALAF